MAHEWWGYWDRIYSSLVYVCLKEFGVVGLDTYTCGIKYFYKCWSGSLATRRLCLGPAGVINCTPLSAASFWVSLFPRTRGYNNTTNVFLRKMSKHSGLFWNCQASVCSLFLSRHNKDLERQTLKPPSACHSSRVLDRPCYGSSINQCYGSILFR